MKKGHFKSRVVEVSGRKVVLDLSPRVLTTKEGTYKQAWPNPDIPKVGDIVRGIFRVKDR